MDDTNEPKVTDVRQATFQYFSTHSWYYALVILILAVGISLSLITSVPHFLFFSLAGIFLMYAFVSVKMRSYLMEQFAKNLGYNFEKTGNLMSVEGLIFNIGHDQKMANVISGKDKDGHKVRVFSYSYTVGYGKNSHTYDNTVFENTFDGEMPHILLHKKELFSDIIPDFSGGEHISLEGDFNKYFSLSVEKSFEMEAYEIFTPDFMEELTEVAKSLNFEFIKNKLYIYTPKFIDKTAELNAMFELSNKFCLQLDPVIRGMKGDVSAMEGLKR